MARGNAYNPHRGQGIVEHNVGIELAMFRLGQHINMCVCYVEFDVYIYVQLEKIEIKTKLSQRVDDTKANTIKSTSHQLYRNRLSYRRLVLYKIDTKERKPLWHIYMWWTLLKYGYAVALNYWYRMQWYIFKWIFSHTYVLTTYFKIVIICMIGYKVIVLIWNREFSDIILIQI